MSTKTVTQPKSAPVVPIANNKDVGPELLQQYGSDSIQFAGTTDALYDRHLIFGRAIDPKAASARERRHGIEELALAHSGRHACGQGV
ncbi:MAG TPA: hypothetical protein VEK33_05360 [Terriglobales bacterium]|nr:hypothetical protein [Terriglobales bacterium]